ncbi:MAG: hypothetical protein ABL897_01385 [Hyphomicrobium sp.]
MTKPEIPISRLPDADMQAAPAALVRSAQRAREIAIRTGTPLIVSVNGKVVEISPAELMREATLNRKP